MAIFKLTKEAAAVEDLDFGFGQTTQTRGTVTKINAEHLPYSATESTTEAIDRKEDSSTIDAKLAVKAALAGDLNQLFSMAEAIENEHGVNLGQLLAKLASKEDTVAVDAKLATKANEDNVLLKDGTSPEFTPVSPNQPATKFYVDELLIDAGAGDMLKSIYDAANTGAVDTAEAIGRTGTFLGQTPMTQVMRLSQSNATDCNIIEDFGIFLGSDVANAPTSGALGVEQWATSSGKAQRCFSFTTNTWYDRTFNGTAWSGWSAGLKNDVNATVLAKYSFNQPITIPNGVDPTDTVNMNQLGAKAETSYVDAANGVQDTAIALNTAKVTGSDRVLQSAYDSKQGAQDAAINSKPTGSWSFDGSTLAITIA